MNLNFVLKAINRKLLEIDYPPLNNIERIIIQGIWNYKTYNLVAQEAGYSPGYLSNVIAPQLLRRISDVVGQKVTKKNCRAKLETYFTSKATSKKTIANQNATTLSTNIRQVMSPRFPSGGISLDSPFYIQRSDIEKQVYAEIENPGALVRIKAPQEMGKTSLLLRVMDYAKHFLDYHVVNLDLQQVDQDIFSNINRFLRWFCVNISRQLNIESRLDDYWDEDIGCKISCSLYFQDYLLDSIDSPILLALDEVNQIFEHLEIAKDFFPLLRSWYEDAKRLPLWQKLRLVVVHSTEIYVPLNLKQSPFNVGLPIQLHNFSLKEVVKLAKCYRLNWTDGEQANLLMAMTGGHPALVHLAIYHLSQGDVTLTELLKTAPTSTGIYSSHLQRHQAKLQDEPELAIALSTAIHTTEPILLEPIYAYKLNSMGLVKLDGNKAVISHQLYRDYFQQTLQAFSFR
ncbi:serine/threonine protein kinase [Okeania hirsuta]|uniref:Serine/threonine protein kinase n=1 Tax=Okeania hirsuta TaxID=1458930 RepID=A0A3N6NZ56_9CYAN|nr:serine/threonine protein kinase [Okeania sp. SIO2B9]NET77556.1 serine/threonine protein kinase [Okeania sp. SIO1F9]RQH18224.1 serine/threonine protein kinase [Okeania hirsuta]RQH53487.1 serine/threonine protein kinase [Okeania hirsuta]